MSEAAPAATLYCHHCDGDFARSEFSVTRMIRSASRTATWSVALVRHITCRREGAMLQKVRERALRRGRL